VGRGETSALDKPKLGIVELLIEVAVAVAGIALIIHLKANYSTEVGEWVLAWF
jgi:hypothetical protein